MFTSSTAAFCFVIDIFLIFRWFTLFYAWGLVWNLVVLYHFTSTLSGRNGSGVATSVSYLLQILFFPNTPPQSPCCCTPLHTQVLLALLLVCFHTGRRLVECLCVTVFSEESKIHLLHCVFGMFFYTALGPGALDDLRKGLWLGFKMFPEFVILF